MQRTHVRERRRVCSALDRGLGFKARGLTLCRGVGWPQRVISSGEAALARCGGTGGRHTHTPPPKGYQSQGQHWRAHGAELRCTGEAPRPWTTLRVALRREISQPMHARDGSKIPFQFRGNATTRPFFPDKVCHQDFCAPPFARRWIQSSTWGGSTALEPRPSAIRARDPRIKTLLVLPPFLVAARPW